ncbi:hypothetical protein IAT38_008306 [Cryptococcus sp. DSM 104549]
MSPNDPASDASGSAGTSHPPKQRKLNRVHPQLKRNSACLPCRRRRIKCDAGKPHCASCTRSFHFLARTHPDEERDAKGVQCFYDDDALEPDHSPEEEQDEEAAGRAGGPKGVKRKATVEDEDPREVIRKLEEQVASLQKSLSNSAAPSAPHPAPAPASSMPAGFTPANHTPFSPIFDLRSDPTLWTGPPQSAREIIDDMVSSSNFTSGPSAAADSFGLGGEPSWVDPRNGNAGPSAATAQGLPPGGSRLDTFPPTGAGYDALDGEAGKVGGQFLDLLWPGWPPTLPTPTMLDHLVETFFTMVPSVPRVLNRQSFLLRLALPPTHPDFPHRALLHAICAAASRYSAAVSVRSVADGIKLATEQAQQAKGKGFDPDIASETCFSDRNAMYAFEFIKYNHVNARGLFDILQAIIILGHWSQSNSRWMDGWVMIGAGTRLAICLGLLGEANDNEPSAQLRRSVLGPPKDDVEREERRAAMYYMLCYDVTTSASSGWASTLPVDELTTRLPSTRVDFDKGGEIEQNRQNYHSPDLFYQHPVADSFVMLVKGKILLGRVGKFVRRTRQMEVEERLFAKDIPEFRQLDGDIAAFNLTFPPSLRDPVQYLKGYAKGVDADLISAHLVPHIAAILLHEPFADLNNPTCASAARLLTEARACLNVVYLIVSSNADISYLFTATRALLLFYQRALESGEGQSAVTFHSEISVFKMAFSALSSRFSMGARHLMMIDMMMRHIEEEVLGQPIVDGNFSALSNPARNGPFTVSLPANGPSVIHGFVSYQGRSGVPETHPDGMIVSELARARAKAAADSLSRGMSIHELLDAKRGFVGNSSRSNSTPGSGSSGPSPNDPLRWMDMSRGSAGVGGVGAGAQRATVTVLSPESSERDMSGLSGGSGSGEGSRSMSGVLPGVTQGVPMGDGSGQYGV